MSAKKLARLSVLTAAALTIFVLEAQIPPVVPIPGVKLGLSSVVTLFVMSVYGRRDAALVLLVRVVLGSMFTGSVSALIFSLAGGLLSYAAMAATIRRFDARLLWVVSVFGAVSHNIGQLLAAIFVTKAVSVVYYAPILLASGIITGVFTGLAAMYLIRAWGKLTDSGR